MTRVIRVACAAFALSMFSSTVSFAQARAQAAWPSPPVTARGLTAIAALDSGVLSYEDVSYDDAVRLLRIALAGNAADTLGPAAKTKALMYLGAAEWFLQHRDSAHAAFRALFAHAPQHRVDSLTFPKVVTDFYGGIRKSLHGLARVRATERGVRVTVYAINPHRVSVDVYTETGKRVLGLYEGVSPDSISMEWDERGTDGRPAAAGRYDIVVTARALNGQLLSVAKFPVVITRTPAVAVADR